MVIQYSVQGTNVCIFFFLVLLFSEERESVMMVYIKRFEFLKALCKFPIIITIIFSKQCLHYIEQLKVRLCNKTLFTASLMCIYCLCFVNVLY